MSETLYVKRGRRYLKWSELDDRVRSEDAQKIARLEGELAKAQAVVDAARAEARKTINYRFGTSPLDSEDEAYREGMLEMARRILRALDGEPQKIIDRSRLSELKTLRAYELATSKMAGRSAPKQVTESPVQTPCPTCGGYGDDGAVPCPTCHGGSF